MFLLLLFQGDKAGDIVRFLTLRMDFNGYYSSSSSTTPLAAAAAPTSASSRPSSYVPNSFSVSVSAAAAPRSGSADLSGAGNSFKSAGTSGTSGGGGGGVSSWGGTYIKLFRAILTWLNSNMIAGGVNMNTRPVRLSEIAASTARSKSEKWNI